VLALVLIVDLARRVRWVRDLYTNAGLLPNHTMLWRPWQARQFSFFFMASLPEETAVLFVIALLCFFFLLIGWRTRLFHVLSFVMTTSLHERNLIAENGGTVALATLMVWTAFLPMGRRFSVDALLASLRARRHEQPDDLSPERLPPPDDRPAVSLAVLAVLVQLAAIYWFNYKAKSGATWRSGTAVHYVLQQERIVTALGVWLRQHLSFATSKLLTQATLGIEAVSPVLILTPIFWRQARALAILALTGLHVGFALLINLGIFSWAMIAYYPLLIDAAFWDSLSRGWRARGRRLVLFYDAGCGVCFHVARVMARFDVLRRVTWIPNYNQEALPAGVEPALLEGTVLAMDPKSGRYWTRSDAFAQVFARLPLGWLWAPVLLLPGLRTLTGYAYDAFARNRTTVSKWLGFAACAIPERNPAAAAPPLPTSNEDSTSPTPMRAWMQARLPLLREISIAAALVVLGADMSLANGSVPEALRWTRRPAWMANAVIYLHATEGWSMFSPDAPVYDMMVVVDAVTRDGRHVDPYNEVGSRVHSLPVDDIPARLDHDSMFCDYTLQIPRVAAYHQALLEWILRYPERTGNPGDAITSFEAIKLEHTPPAPGQMHSTDVRRSVFLKWPQ
jgi:predicted DCC family thiol-disulfide oxidoreductase YuxK